MILTTYENLYFVNINIAVIIIGLVQAAPLDKYCLEDLPSNEFHVNPEEHGNFFEGDILLRSKRNGVISKHLIWNKGEIPFAIDGDYNKTELDIIMTMMDVYHNHTCIRFRPRISTDVDFISITNDEIGCFSNVGRVGGKQVLNLSKKCFLRVGTPIHEMMHVIGFMHEQNRVERDEYISIEWSNINTKHYKNFKKSDEKTISGYGVPYDINSVMHYSSHAFSNNSKPSIVLRSKLHGYNCMGQREGLTPSDLMKVRRMYKCPNDSISTEESEEDSDYFGLYLP